MISGVNHKVMYYKYLSGYHYDAKKQTVGDPIYSNVVLFLSDNKKKISKVTVKETGLEDYEDVYEIEHVGVGEDLKPQWAHDIFDKNSDIYSKFSFFDLDKKQIPASEMGKISTDTMTEQLLHFPLVNSNGDTITLNHFKGWVLMDFWILGCKPCAEFHKLINQERKKSGKIPFQDTDIKLITIYILGGNSPTFRNYVSEYNIADISYAARDISTVINTPSFPRYFLISPDKQIVYISDTLSDYSALLQAKKEYEQKNPARNGK
jgi:thiol-disulfide isomerase/thioredoxin